MKKIISFFAILAIACSLNAQSLVNLPEKLSNTIKQQISSSEANGIVMTQKDQDELIYKLAYLQDALNAGSANLDMAALSKAAGQDKANFEESKYFQIKNEYFKGVESMADIKSRCLIAVSESRPMDEIKFFTYLSYSLQIIENYNDINVAGKRKPCNFLNYLEAGAIGFAICGPWCSTGTILILAFTGCN